MFANVPIWGVILGGLSAMIVGALWYSPYLFGKTWSKAIGISDEQMSRGMAKVMPILLLVSLLTAYVLALFIVYFMSYSHKGAVVSGVEVGLLAAIGFACTALVAHGVFDPRPKNGLYINLGNRIVTLIVMGAIIGLFIK